MTGTTWAIIACGSSVQASDINQLEGRARVIVVNDSWRLCPWADVLYAADQRWWKHHQYVLTFKGERWTQQQGTVDWPEEAKLAGIQVIHSVNNPGISFDPQQIHTGMNSGFQALNLAVLWGATRILLLGVDMAILDGKRHWFGDHPRGLHRNSPYASFSKAFILAAPQLKRAGIEVINCSLRSTLNCFPKMTIAETLA